MSEFIEVKTADLIGPALDYATGIADGEQMFAGASLGGVCAKRLCADGDTRDYYSPSTDWNIGGPLIKKYGVMLSPPASMVHRNYGNFDKRNGYYESGVWSTTIFAKERKHRRAGFSHETDPLIPAMRAIVQFELGDVVSVPAELMP